MEEEFVTRREISGAAIQGSEVAHRQWLSDPETPLDMLSIDGERLHDQDLVLQDEVSAEPQEHLMRTIWGRHE